MTAEADAADAGRGADVLSLAESALRSAPLDRRFTSEQCVAGRPNELAHAAARRVAEK